jgi:ribose-phosphate pyrophosphokinase
MIIIAGPSHASLGKMLARRLSAEFVLAKSKKFEDQELTIRLEGILQGQEVMILQSTCPPANDHLMELLLLAHTAKRLGSVKVTALVPYLGYSRQDALTHPGDALSAQLMATLMEASGIDHIMTIDLHSKSCEGFFKIDVQNLDPWLLFKPFFPEKKTYVVVSPDEGSVPRARILAEKLNAEVAFMRKARNSSGKCEISEIIGHVYHKNCILVDDIVDTGETLYEAVKCLKAQKATSISACITHGVFSGSSIKKIEELRFHRFCVTDTIYQASLPPFIHVVSIKDLLIQGLLSPRTM